MFKSQQKNHMLPLSAFTNADFIYFDLCAILHAYMNNALTNVEVLKQALIAGMEMMLFKDDLCRATLVFVKNEHYQLHEIILSNKLLFYYQKQGTLKKLLKYCLKGT